MTNTIGERIRQMRESKGVSQGRLGKEIGTSGTLVGSWERGEVEPRGTSLNKIASALGVLPEWLRTGKGPKTAGEAMSSRPHTDWASETGATTNHHPVPNWGNVRAEEAEVGDPDAVLASDGLRLAAAVREALSDGNGNVSPDTAQMLAAMAQELYASHLRRNGWSVPGGPLGKAFIQVYHRMITNDPALLHDQKLFDLILALAKDMVR